MIIGHTLCYLEMSTNQSPLENVILYRPLTFIDRCPVPMIGEFSTKRRSVSTGRIATTASSFATSSCRPVGSAGRMESIPRASWRERASDLCERVPY